MVDGVLASCYAFPDHDLAHIGMMPIRLFPEMAVWIFGDDNGSSVIGEIFKHLGELMLPFSLNGSLLVKHI